MLRQRGVDPVRHHEIAHGPESAAEFPPEIERTVMMNFGTGDALQWEASCEARVNPQRR